MLDVGDQLHQNHYDALIMFAFQFLKTMAHPADWIILHSNNDKTYLRSNGQE